MERGGCSLCALLNECQDLQGWKWGLYLTGSPRLLFWVKAVTSNLSCSLPSLTLAGS